MQNPISYTSKNVFKQLFVIGKNIHLYVIIQMRAHFYQTMVHSGSPNIELDSK